MWALNHTIWRSLLPWNAVNEVEARWGSMRKKHLKTAPEAQVLCRDCTEALLAAHECLCPGALSPWSCLWWFCLFCFLLPPPLFLCRMWLWPQWGAASPCPPTKMGVWRSRGGVTGVGGSPPAEPVQWKPRTLLCPQLCWGFLDHTLQPEEEIAPCEPSFLLSLPVTQLSTASVAISPLVHCPLPPSVFQSPVFTWLSAALWPPGHTLSLALTSISMSPKISLHLSGVSHLPLSTAIPQPCAPTHPKPCLSFWGCFTPGKTELDLPTETQEFHQMKATRWKARVDRWGSSATISPEACPLSLPSPSPAAPWVPVSPWMFRESWQNGEAPKWEALWPGPTPKPRLPTLCSTSGSSQCHQESPWPQQPPINKSKVKRNSIL